MPKKKREHAARWWKSLSLEQQKAYVERKISEKNERKRLTRVFDPALNPRTKYPFETTINGRRVIVWPDWFEYDDPVTT